MISTPATPPATKSDRLRALLARCHDDPSLFNAAILGGSPFWWRQEQMARAVVQYHTVVVAGGNAIGKDHWLGRMVLWWLCTRYGSLVVTTAPTDDSLDSTLWKNLRRAAESSLVPLGIKLGRKPLRADLGRDWLALGIATRKTERISGRHEGQLLVAVTEASGVEPEIWAGIDSLVPRKVILIGNPLRYEGPFRQRYDQGLAEAKDPAIPDSERVFSLRVPSTDSPDCGLEHSERGLASGGWLRQMGRRHGRHSLWWRTHVDALFPDAPAAVLLLDAWLDRAAASQRIAPPRHALAGPRRTGCDLGEGVGRDQGVVLTRDNLGVLEVSCSATMGLEEAAREMARHAEKWSIDDEHRSYDAGGLGKKMPNHLARYGLKARAYFGSGSGGEEFKNLRSAAAWALHLRLDPGHAPDVSRPDQSQPPFVIPPQDWWPALRQELAELRYELVGTKTKLENKEDLTDRLGRSPDLADALIQTFSY